jgi:hypothetical protein
VEQNNEMRLIGAGLPRTATLSQKLGLEVLGLGPCYHMVEVLKDLRIAEDWFDALEGHADWDRIFAGYPATVDWPAAFFYKELIDYYPDAKVLLSVRDADGWARSMYDTLWGIVHGDTLMHDLSLARYRIDPLWRRYTDFMRAMFDKSGLFTAMTDGVESGEIAMAMDQWNAEVIATVPADRLLVWRAEDGFGPICDFLDLPVPEAPFPWENGSDSFSDFMNGATLAALNDWYAAQEHVPHG